MRGLVLVFIIVLAVLSLSFVIENVDFLKIEKNEYNEPIKNFEFKTFTSAVCEDKEEVIHCKDEVFANCNGKISKVIYVAECDGIKLDIPKVTGFAVFEKGWKDKRNQ